MLTIIEKDSALRICNNEEKVITKSPKEFMDDLGKFLKPGGEIYIDNLSFWGLAIIKRLRELELVDLTEIKLADFQTPIENNSFFYIISADNGAFYKIEILYKGKKTKIYEFRNLISVDLGQIEEEFEAEDVVAMHRAICSIRDLGVRGSTISQCSYTLWKNGFNRFDFRAFFPPLDDKAEKICRDAYHGGLCLINPGYKGNKYVNKGFEKCKRVVDGCVLDVNSLYAYVMKNRRFASGKGHYGEGDVPEAIKENEKTTYYIRFRASFQIKKDHIPFVRTRCDEKHFSMEKLENSFYTTLDGHTYEYEEIETVDEWGEIHRDIRPMTVELCMYKPEFELFQEFYDIEIFEPIEYVWFYTSQGIFDRYVDRFFEGKKNAKTSGERRINKLFLNALTGRLSAKKVRRSAYVDSKSIDMLSRRIERNKGKKTDHFMGERITDFFAGELEVESQSSSHIQIGAAITSEAMVYIIRKAQANYEHFVYTDTDSLHLDITPDKVKDVTISEELGDFKVEHEIYYGLYFKEKINFIVEEKEDKFKYNLTFAGLPSDCQDIIERFCASFVVGSEIKVGDIGAIIDIDKFYDYIVGDEFRIKRFITNAKTFKHDADDVDGIIVPRIIKKIADYDTYELKEELDYFKVDIFSRVW